MSNNITEKKESFEMGEIVRSNNLFIMVTGKGKKRIGYPVFSGVVIMSVLTEENDYYPIGFYSDTWTTEVFINTKRHIDEAAEHYALEQLGDDQFKGNKDAAKAISDDFKAGFLVGCTFIKPTE